MNDMNDSARCSFGLSDHELKLLAYGKARDRSHTKLPRKGKLMQRVLRIAAMFPNGVTYDKLLRLMEHEYSYKSVVRTCNTLRDRGYLWFGEKIVTIPVDPPYTYRYVVIHHVKDLD